MTVENKSQAKPGAEDSTLSSSIFQREYAALALDFPGENGSLAYLFTAESLGHGDKELGADLLKPFFDSILAKRLYPNYIVLLNSAVFLSTESSRYLSSLETLEKRGTSILVSEESIDFYEIRSKIQVGILSSMEEIIMVLSAVDKVIGF